MGLYDQVKKDFKKTLKTRENEKLSVLKMLSAAILNEEIRLNKKGEGLTDEETLKVVKLEAKKRKDSIEAYTKAGRNDLAEKEKKELLVLGVYLPEEMASEKIEKIVKEAIKKTSAKSMRDFGKVMKETMGKIKGRTDGNKVSEIVKRFLAT